MILKDLLENLPQRPRFNFFSFADVNPLSGRSKRRVVAAPNEAMKTLQRRFLAHLRSRSNEVARDSLLGHATSSNSGDSPLRNIQYHRHNRFLYLLDFTHAYASVKPEQLAPILIRFYPFCNVPVEEMDTFLKSYFFDKIWGLVPGGPASQDLFNLYAGSLVDLPIAGLLAEKGVVYTRYIDDLTFSSASPIPESVRRGIRHSVVEAGFLINHRKCEHVDLSKRTVVITGIGLDHGGRLFVPRSYLLKIRGLMHRAITKGGVEKGRIEGMVAFFKLLLQDQPPNKLEQRVLSEYRQYLARRT